MYYLRRDLRLVLCDLHGERSGMDRIGESENRQRGILHDDESLEKPNLIICSSRIDSRFMGIVVIDAAPLEMEEFVLRKKWRRSRTHALCYVCASPPHQDG